VQPRHRHDTSDTLQNHHRSSTSTLRKKRRFERQIYPVSSQRRTNSDQTTRKTTTCTNGNCTTTDDDNDDDNFEPNYGSLEEGVAIPSSHDLIDTVVLDVIQQWRRLDERKITAGIQQQQQQPNNNDSTTNDTNDNIRNTKALPKWYEKHVRLPEQFDYATVQAEPPHDDGSSGDRVIQLDDPTNTGSYHTELWKLFATIPTRQQLEESVCTQHSLPHTALWFQQHGPILQGNQPCSATNFDTYGFSRFRLNDRHDLPVLPTLQTPALPTRRLSQNQRSTNLESDPISTANTHTSKDYCGLIRFECVRKQFRRTSTPDSNRMVLEFHESHTLLDVHNAIVELTDDELWYDYAATVPLSSISMKSDDDDDDDGEEDGSNDGKETDTDGNCTSNIVTGADTVEPPPQPPDKETPQVEQPGAQTIPDPSDLQVPKVACDDANMSSGYFMIENTFYRTGAVDYTIPILRWLQSGTVREQKRRLEYLGMGPNLPIVQFMKDVRLYDLPTRLGVRYVHGT
jgi:snRNA-activating protein complex (SNAPc), subunit 3